MGKRKTAAKPKTPPIANDIRRFVLVNPDTGTEIGGADPRKKPDRKTWGMSWDVAEERGSNLAMSVQIVEAWTFFGYDDPELGEE